MNTTGKMSHNGGARPKTKISAAAKQNPTRSMMGAASSDQKTLHRDSSFYHSGNLKISVHQGSITDSHSSAIVNSESVFLKSKTQLAVAIGKCAGQVYRDNLEKLAREYPKNRSGSVFIIRADSNNAWKIVIAVVAPVWTKVGKDSWKKQMKQIIEDVLNRASVLSLKSVAFPLIGSGKRNAPLEDVFDAFCETFKFTKQPGIQEVEIFVTDANTYQMLCKHCESVLQIGTVQQRGSVSAQGSKNKSKRSSSPDSNGNLVKDRDTDDTNSDEHSLSGEGTVGKERQWDVERDTDDEDNDTCAICMDNIDESQRRELACKHVFCNECVEEWFKRSRNACPTCNKPCGIITGNQPHGEMSFQCRDDFHLPGYERYGCFVINYDIDDGVQGDNHPNPGTSFSGTCRTAYLPDTREGRKVLELLKIAFERKLIFTVGTSSTSGRQNVVTWNDIHHKTRIHGGPEGYGYPDPTYLNRVTEELAAKGVTLDDDYE